MVIMLAEAFAYHERDLREKPELYGDVLREKFIAGGAVHRRRVRAGPAAPLADARGHGRGPGEVDVLGDPDHARTRAIRSPPRSTRTSRSPRSNMPPFNMAGLPALAVPCGFTEAGLPLSLQIAGRPFDEATVLRAGHAYEQATDWHRRRPPI